MQATRLSLLYPVGYLTSAGLMLGIFPRLALSLLFSHADYGDVLPRMAGVLTFGLGVIVLQIVRHRAESVYKTLIGIRYFFCACWIALYLFSGDAMFLSLLGVVGFGTILSTVAVLVDARRASDPGRGAGAPALAGRIATAAPTAAL